jgi:ubiquinone/menaquinone biosynthesis C-methylase UbiE
MTENPVAAGKSSFDLIDPAGFFDALELRRGTVLLDVGCGAGSYALAAAEKVGVKGTIYAVDLWEEGIATLSREVALRRIKNIHPLVADVSRKIPVADRSIDVCLMATVLHDLIADGTADGTLREVERVLKPGGQLAVVEFDKVEGPPGPPRAIRLSPAELDAVLAPRGFHLLTTTVVGPYNYLSVYNLGFV